MASSYYKFGPSRIENGIEICNACGRPTDLPFRCLDVQTMTETGCASTCHDAQIISRFGALPTWITDCRVAVARWNVMWEARLVP